VRKPSISKDFKVFQSKVSASSFQRFSVSVFQRLPSEGVQKVPEGVLVPISAKPTSWPSPCVGLSRVVLIFLCCSVLSFLAFQRFSFFFGNF
jgi:hypothetical protein